QSANDAPARGAASAPRLISQSSGHAAIEIGYTYQSTPTGSPQRMYSDPIDVAPAGALRRASMKRSAVDQYPFVSAAMNRSKSRSGTNTNRSRSLQGQA